MTKIHYFQRYSSKENTVTNNTLQLVARIYEHSTAAASQLLRELTGTDIDIGIEVVQQERMGDSIPDGTILQRSFKVLIEAKVDSPVDPEQLLRHAGKFEENDRSRILLLLTRQPIDGSEQARIDGLISSEYPTVTFRSITYQAICRAADSLFREHETSMVALVEDYKEYCAETGLFDQSGALMRVVPCGKSLELNKKYDMYFQPTDRGYSPHALIGIYADRAVRAIIDVRSVFDIEIQDGVLTRKDLCDGSDTDEFDADPCQIVEEARTACGYEIATGHRFFCGDIFETEARKSTPGGLMGQDSSTYGT